MEAHTDPLEIPETNHCQFCGQYHPVGIRFCPTTGQTLLRQMRLTCPNCGQEVNEAWLRCPHCATMLQSHPQQIAQRQTIWRRQGWILLPIIILGLVSVSFTIGMFWMAGGGANEEMEVPLNGSQGSPTEQSPLLGVNLTPTVSPKFTSIWTLKSTQNILPLTETATSTPSPRPSLTLSATPDKGPWDPCPGSYLSRLHVNDQAYVALDPPLANRVRTEPSKKSTIIGRIQPGEEMKILDGPVCKDGWIWWKVQEKRTDLVGWTSEGEVGIYWLVPLP